MMQVSIVPDIPRVAIAISKLHRTGELIRDCGAFGLHLLTPEQSGLAYFFGTKSGRDFPAGSPDVIDKFAGMSIEPGGTGSPRLVDAHAGWLECRVLQTTDIGDRHLHVAEVVDSAPAVNQSPPLMLHEWISGLSDEQRAELKLQRSNDAELDRVALS